MLRRAFQHIRLTSLILGFLFLGLTQLSWFRNDLPFILRLEGWLFDSRYLLRSAKQPDPRIKIVGIEASSLTLDTLSPSEIASSPVLALMQQPWPWDRRVYAETAKKILEAGAKVVVLDLVFRGNNPGNAALAEVVNQYPDRIVLASFFDSSRDGGEKLQYIEPQEDIIGTNGPLRAGFANVWPDRDGVIRRSRYATSLEREYGLSSVGGQDLDALSLLAARQFKGAILLPPEENEGYINFAGPPGTYSIIPLEYLFVESLWRDTKSIANGAAFKDKIVIIGPLAEVFKDVHLTPLGSMPGPEIQANLVSNLLQASGLKLVARKWSFWLEAALILSVPLICLRIQKATGKAMLMGAILASYLVIGCTLFNYGKVIPMAAALAGFVGAGSSVLLLQYAGEQYERLRTRSLLDRYVSRNVAQVIMQDQRSFVDSLQGQRKAVTVLFSDIRGFTTLSEAARAEELVSQLNEYFQEMVGIILREGGTLQKFIGDAIMAVWGDTHSLGAEEDARRAVRSALAMRSALGRLNETWQGQAGRKELAIGIGINHGEVVVGNIGHPQRMEFTVLGDAVNLASRLESATKSFQQDLLIGESVYRLTSREFAYRTVDYLVVKGKTKPIEVYTIPGEGIAGLRWLELYHQALRHYRAQEFAGAAAQFEKVAGLIGRPDALCEMYYKQCQEYLLHPPPKDWNGVRLLKEK